MQAQKIEGLAGHVWAVFDDPSPEGQLGVVHLSAATDSEAAALSAYQQSIEPIAPDLAAYAADKRWRVEEGGTIWNGWPVATDRTSQQKVLAEFVAVGGGLRAENSTWKFADGFFRAVSNAAFPALAMAVRAHVEAAFATEATICAGIDGATITTVEQIDAAAWPVGL